MSRITTIRPVHRSGRTFAVACVASDSLRTTKYQLASALLSVCCLTCLLPQIVSGDETESSSLATRLQTVGIALPNTPNVILPAPAIQLSMPTDEREALLQELAGRHGWEKFARRGLNTPLHIKSEYVLNDQGERIGHSIYSAFIAYAPIGKLRDEQLMESVFGKLDSASQDGTQIADLSDAELATLGLEDSKVGTSKYAKLKMTLLKKVVIEGVLHIELQDNEDAILMNWILESEFPDREAQSPPDTSLNSLSNTWVKLLPNRVGKRVPTEPVLYQGLGGAMSVTQTGLAPDQFLVESRMVIHEPSDWFSGSKLLRSKFSLMMQESAKNMRRKLLKLYKE